MQTFLPYPNFINSAKCLDNKRLNKQRVEVKQILRALGVKVGSQELSTSSAWKHHPAVLMWKGYELTLCKYGIVICEEQLSRGYKDSLLPQFHDTAIRLEQSSHSSTFFRTPWWLGFLNFHASHRSNLLRKDPVHYSQFGWTEHNDLEYVWPVRHND
jgi:hypothetical protein